MDPIIVFHHLMSVYREDEVQFFSGVHSERQEATDAFFGKEITFKKKSFPL